MTSWRILYSLTILASLGLVESSPAAVWEVEPNNVPAQATLIPTGPDGDWASGGIGPSDGDPSHTDWFRINGALTDSILFAYINDDNPFNEGEPLLRCFAADGSTQLHYEIPDRVAGITIPQAGPVYLEVTEQGAMPENLSYSVLQYLAPAWDRASETEPNDSVAQATPVSAGVVSGSVSGTDVDYYSFEITESAEQWVLALVDNDPDKNCFYESWPVYAYQQCTYTVLDLVDAMGNSVAYRAGGYDGYSSLAEGFSSTVPGIGTYYLKVSAGPDDDPAVNMDDDYRFALLLAGRSMTPVCSITTETLDLANGTCIAPEVYEACKVIQAGPDYAAMAGCQLTLRAPVVTFNNGFEVVFGELTVDNSLP